MLASAVLPSCTGDQIEVEDPSGIVLQDDKIDAPVEGGVFSIGYELTNPKDELVPDAACDGDWVNVVFSEEGKMTVEIEPNPLYEVRQAEITVTYGEDDDNVVSVSQAAAELPDEFEIVIEDRSCSSLVYGINPLDDEMTYMHRLYTEDFIDKFASVEDFFSYEIESYRNAADKVGVSLEEFLDNFLSKGPVSGNKHERLPADKNYVICSYGMDNTGAVLTALDTAHTSTLAVEMIDASFTVTCTVERTDVHIKIEPSDPGQMYYYEVVEKEEFGDGKDYLRITEGVIRQEIYIAEDMYGLSYEDALAMVLGSYTSKGVVEEDMSLDADTEYIAYAIAVNDQCYFCSECFSSQFVTEGVESSDNEFTITVDNIETRIADYSVSVKNDDPYLFGIIKASECSGLEDDEIISMLLDRGAGMYKSGNISGRMNELLPETEYLVYAFGCEAGAATTGLSSITFTTWPVVQSDITFRLVLDKYFRGGDFQDKYPDEVAEGADISGSALIPTMVEALPKERLQVCYYNIYAGDWTDPDDFSDDAAIADLVAKGSSWRKNTLLLEYDKEFTLIGVSVDISGNYGKVWRQKVYYTVEGASPIDEYEDYEESLDPYH